jgi:hypothetical protein
MVARRRTYPLRFSTLRTIVFPPSCPHHSHVSLELTGPRCPASLSDVSSVERRQLQRIEALFIGGEPRVDGPAPTFFTFGHAGVDAVERWELLRDGKPAFDAWVFYGGNHAAVFTTGTDELVAHTPGEGVGLEQPGEEWDEALLAEIRDAFHAVIEAQPASAAAALAAML